jgi:hypothetical protein
LTPPTQTTKPFFVGAKRATNHCPRRKTNDYLENQRN